MDEIRFATTVRRQRLEVAEGTLDPCMFPGWMPYVKTVKLTAGLPCAPGGTYEAELRRGWKRWIETIEIIDFKRGQSMSARMGDAIHSFDLVGMDGGILVRYQCRPAESAKKKRFESLREFALRRALLRGMRDLKGFIESGEFRKYLQPDVELF